MKTHVQILFEHKLYDGHCLVPESYSHILSAMDEYRHETICEIIKLVENSEWGIMDNDIDAKKLLTELEKLKYDTEGNIRWQ